MRVALLSVLLIFSVSAVALKPESGIYYTPDSGYTLGIEIQNDIMGVTVFAWDSQTGDPFFMNAGGRMEGDRFFDARLDLPVDGPCFGCDWVPADVVANFGGRIRIEFTDIAEGLVRFGNGPTLEFVRQRFGYGNDTVSPLLGEWSFILDFSSEPDVNFPYSGDIVIFDDTLSDGSGDYVTGCRPADSLSGFCSADDVQLHSAIAVYDEEFDEHVILLDNSVNYYLALYLNTGFQSAAGVSEIYLKNTNGNGIYYPTRGTRTASFAYVDTGSGPARAQSPTNKSGWITPAHSNGKNGVPDGAKSTAHSAKRAMLVQMLINKHEQLKVERVLKD